MFPQVFGKYVLERELARGGMARVVLATLRGAGGFEKKLVVKQIRDELAYDQQFIRRFVAEAKTMVALSHPNIVPVYELGVEQGTYFLAMELVEGVSVADLLRERNEDGSRRVLTPEEGAYLGIEVCRALDYAHRRMKVVHRDITPRNVMIDEEGEIKLIDFGIATPARVSGQEVLGSPGHMAPEQVDGGELGPPTDIFAVAVLLMEAWTGSAPFRRATPEECAAAVRQPHPRPSDFDRRLSPLDAAIGRAMRLDRRERQQEASVLARELRAFLRGCDVADVARALGDRVRALREAGSPSPPPRTTAPRASFASHGDLGTKTFAAREEALSWSDGVPGTRRLKSSAHVRAARGRADDPAMAIQTPLMVDIDELERIHSDIAASRSKRSELAALAAPAGAAKPSEGPPARRSDPVRRGDPPVHRLALEPAVETMATRPLETHVRAVDVPSTPLTKTKRGMTVAVVVGAVALLATGGIAAWRAGVGAASLDDDRSSVMTALPAEIVEAEPAVPRASSEPVVAKSAPSEVPAAPTPSVSSGRPGADKAGSGKAGSGKAGKAGSGKAGSGKAGKAGSGKAATASPSAPSSVSRRLR